MRKFVIFAIAGSVLSAAAAPAFAQDARWTDAEFLRASRCLGLAQAKGLGVLDASALNTQLKSQARGRTTYVLERGDAIREEGKADGRTKNEEMKAKLLSERDGVCKAYLGAAVAAAS